MSKRKSATDDNMTTDTSARVKMQLMSQLSIDEDENAFHHIPKEIMIKIFSYLSRADLCKRVCMVSTRFRDLAYDPSFYTKLKFANFKLNYESLETSPLLKRCNMLKKMEVHARGFVSLTIKALELCRELNELRLYGDFYHEENVSALFDAIDNSKSLKKLHLEVRWDSQMLSEKANCLKRITHLTLKSSYNRYHAGELVAIGEKCERLAVFTYKGHLNHFDTDAAATAFISLLNARKDTLEELSVDTSMLKNPAVPASMALCQRLHALHLSGAKTISYAYPIPKEVGSLPNLTTLHFTEHDISDDELGVIAESCPNLTHLDVSNDPYEMRKTSKVSNVGLLKIVDNCRNLTHLNVSRCDNITNVGMIKLANNCPSLSHLDISYCSVSNIGLARILLLCKALTELNIVGVGMICSDSFIPAINLRKLVILSNDYSISVDVLMEIKKLLPQLRIHDLKTSRNWK